MNFARITLLAGHYGSGKTQLALNIALLLKQTRPDVALVDLDIVNPYFRSSDHAEMLRAHGVRLIASEFAGSNVELPGLPSETAAVFDSETLSSVMDIGGDDRGAVALGRYAEKLRREATALLVVNRYRLLTADADAALQIMREIERAGHIRFQGIVNNSNLGVQTTARDVLATREFAERVGALAGLPVVLTAVMASLADEVAGEIGPLLPLTIYDKSVWRI